MPSGQSAELRHSVPLKRNILGSGSVSIPNTASGINQSRSNPIDFMRVGITTDFRNSAFSSGIPNACLALAKIFNSIHATIVLLYNHDGPDWWSDIGNLKEEYTNRVHLSNATQMDLLIEIAFHIPPSNRAKLATKSVWYCRKSILFNDLESSVYNSKHETSRDLTGISAIWAADIFTGPDDLSYLETLYPTIPITIVPFLWTPDIVEAHRKEYSSPIWCQMIDGIPKKWSIHIPESNQSNTSCCIIPLTIMRYTLHNQSAPIKSVTIHNSDHIRDLPFFKENIVKHCSITPTQASESVSIPNIDISYNFTGRQRVIDWVQDPYSIVLSHTRFIPLKLQNLEAAWVGIPVIHNNPILRDLGHGLEKLYYFENNITDARSAIQTVLNETIDYCKSAESLIELRLQIAEKFHPLKQIDPWMKAIESVFEIDTLKGTVCLNSALWLESITNTVFNVLFTDMWDNFNESYNMFTLALIEYLKDIGNPMRVNGLSAMKENTKPDLVIFGPFGNTWKSLPAEWPKVHFTGENTDPIYEPSVKLNIGYKHLAQCSESIHCHSDQNYLRMPLWMFEIDWFSADLNRIQNPIPIPVSACITVDKVLEPRPKFCAFVVTNPRNPIRNEAFHILNTYKPVDSAGRLFNNVGPGIYAGLGGGGGEYKKFEFLKDYRFCLVYENESSPGYTTEKLLHAKAAGCIPIYWGDPMVGKDFDEKGFLNANHCKTPQDLIDLVKDVEENLEKQHAIRSIPALSSCKVRTIFSEMARRFLVIAGLESKAQVFLINLDRRPDRLQSFYEHHPDLQNITRISATDGLTLELNESLITMFKNNDFFWKKAIIGCAMSHLSIWNKFILRSKQCSESIHCNYTECCVLILEDDVRLSPGWKDAWNCAYKELPDTWECVYLGGILPPNRIGFSSVIEHFSPNLGRIAPNMLFGQVTPTRYFHFCTYAYALSKTGAQKLLDTVLGTKGFFTSADHMISNCLDQTNIYFLNPLMAGASQENDPRYTTAEFNNFNRIDTFDSDIWNNDERFVFKQKN